MNANQLSKRLAAAARFVPNDARLADIGSDHAYLPVYLVKEGIIDYAIAGEVVEGPYQSAITEISEQKLTTNIEARLGDGLEVVQPEDQIDVVTICGMGGKLIAEILARGLNNQHFNQFPLLVLQPNVWEPGLRKWLLNHQYDIVAETVVAEHHKYYEIIVAKPTETPSSWTEDELLFGRFSKRTAPEDFKEKWQHVYEQYGQILSHFKETNNEESLAKKAEMINYRNKIKQCLEAK